MNKPSSTQDRLQQIADKVWTKTDKYLRFLPTGLIFKSMLVALVMSLFFCLSTDQLAIWPSLYPKAALVAISCNLLLSIAATRLLKRFHTKETS